MTTVHKRQPRRRTRSTPTGPAAPARARTLPTAVRVASTAMTILSAALLGFAVYLGFASRLHHDRAQFNGYANFRVELAQAIAPTGQTQPGDPGRLLRPGTPVAVLDLPQLRLKEVVFEGTDASVLEDGPGHLRSTPLPGQAGVSEIMGRATLYGGPFGRISTLAPGDTFTVTTGQGVHTYTVRDVRRADDPQPPPLAPGAGRLILATADGNPFLASDVIRVDADLTSPVQLRSPLVFGRSQLSGAELVMATDRTAWLPVVGLGFVLLLAGALAAWTRHSWGGPQTWIVAVPVLCFLGLAVADRAAALLPNLS
jgi:sortase A